MSNIILKISGGFLGLFGIISMIITSSLIFNIKGFSHHHANQLPYLLYVNFACSFLYLFASYGFFTKNKWTTACLFVTVAILILSYVGLIIHIQAGGLFDIFTIKLMLVKVSLTILFAGISWFYLTRTKLVALESYH
jgi:hypothetical protein